jgi:hypothetical protein
MPELNEPRAIRKWCGWWALATIAVALALKLFCPFTGRPLPRGLHAPIFAMEVASRPAEIVAIIGCGTDDVKAVPCQGSESAAKDRASMRAAQIWDFVLIGCYGMLFLGMGWLESLNRKWLGWPIMALTIAAAFCDVMENRGILQALDHLETGPNALAISLWAWPKWRLLFVILLLQVPLLWGDKERSAGVKVFGRALTVFAISSGLWGLLASSYRQPARLEGASPVLTIIPLFALALAIFSEGIAKGFDDLAKSFWLNWISRWPEFLLGEGKPVEQESLRSSPDQAH